MKSVTPVRHSLEALRLYRWHKPVHPFFPQHNMPSLREILHGPMVWVQFRMRRDFRDPAYLGPRIVDKLAVTLITFTLCEPPPPLPCWACSGKTSFPHFIG